MWMIVLSKNLLLREEESFSYKIKKATKEIERHVMDSYDISSERSRVWR